MIDKTSPEWQMPWWFITKGDIEMLQKLDERLPNRALLVRIREKDYGPYLLRQARSGLRFQPISCRTAWALYLTDLSKQLGFRPAFRQLGDVKNFASCFMPSEDSLPPTKEILAIRHRASTALFNDQISESHRLQIIMCHDPVAAERLLAKCIKLHGEYRLMADIETHRIASRRRTISIIGLAVFISVVIVWMAYIAHKS